MRVAFLIAIVSLFFAACNSEQPVNTDTVIASGPAKSAEEYKKESEAPDIKIQVEGVNGGLANLIGVFAEQNYRADSAAIDASGQVVFKKAEPYQPGLFFVTMPGNVTLQVLVGQDQTFSMKTKATDPVNSMQVEGSLDNQLLYESLKFEDQQRPKFNENAAKMAGVRPGTPEYLQVKKEQDALLDARINYLNDIFKKNPESLFTKFKRAGQNPDVRDTYKADGTMDTARYLYVYRSRFWDGVDFSDLRLLYTPVISNKLKRYISELTPQQPDSILASSYSLVDKTLNYPEYFKYFANWIVLHYDPKESTLMDAQAVFANMIQKYFTYDKAFWSDSAEIHALQLRAYEMAASLVGKKGPDVQAPDPTGKPRSIYEIKAPYIIVYMYDPKCEHCAEQTPLLVNFYKQWKSKGVEVFGIAINTNDADWKAYIAKEGMTWPNVFDPTNKSIYAKYFVDITPEVYVLNPDRIIIGKNLHVDQIATIIERDREKRG